MKKLESHDFGKGRKQCTKKETPVPVVIPPPLTVPSITTLTPAQKLNRLRGTTKQKHEMDQPGIVPYCEEEMPDGTDDPSSVQENVNHGSRLTISHSNGMSSSKLVAGLSTVLKNSFVKQPPHLIVKARAGTGKTTTLIEGLKYMRGMPVSITPSPQQQAIWDSMALSKDARTVCMTAFNSSIAKELKNRVPIGVEAKTLHGLGFYAFNRAFPMMRGRELNEYRVRDLTAEILGVERSSCFSNPGMMQVLLGVNQLVDLCKMSLVDGDEESLYHLSDHHGIDLGDKQKEIFSLVPEVLEACKDPHKGGMIDYCDMIWLPVILNLPVFTNDLILVDEFQDLCRCQHALVIKAGRRIVGVGDDFQAIYGFAGADAESMERMTKELNAQVLPLTVTRRCGKAIVAEAQRMVPDFEAHESNSEGEVRRASYGSKENPTPNYRSQVRDGDMVLCRNNAPLVNQCFKFLKEGRKATIQGRKDIGRGLIDFIERIRNKMEPGPQGEIPRFIAAITDWLKHEEAKENAKKDPKQSKIAGLHERYDCLVFFCDEIDSVDAIIRKIDVIFTDNQHTPGIILSSIHKAKGLENNRVFLLMPSNAPCPAFHPKMKSWQMQQERNIFYVAITRAIRELSYVS